MTLETFAKRTGWPLQEILDIPVDEFTGILALMGLKLVVKPNNTIFRGGYPWKNVTL